MTYVPGSLRVNGVVHAKAFLQFSDLRFKADVKDLTDALNIISKLEGKSFVWKKGEEDTQEGGRRVIGFIAQEVRKVIPEVVHEDENGYLSVAYAELVPFVVQGLKELMVRTEQEKQETREQLRELEQRLLKLEQDRKDSDYQHGLKFCTSCSLSFRG